MSDIKILMLSEYPYHPHDAFQGGIMQSTAQLIKSISHLQDDTIKIEILTLSKEAQYLERRIIDPNISVTFVPSKSNNFLNFFIHKPYFFVQFLYEIYQSDAKLIHGQGTILYNTLAILTSKVSVNTIHGIYQNELKALGAVSIPNKLKNAIKISLEKFYLRRVKNLIAISDEIIDLVTSRSNLKNIIKINNAIDDIFFQVHAETAHNKAGLRLLFVAAITPRKGLHNLLEAMDRLDGYGADLKLTIAGIESWFPEYVQNLKNKYHHLITSEKVVFEGEVSQRDLVELYAKADFLILPTLAESAPMVIAQSLATGTPVIASDVGEVRNMLSDGTFGILTIPDDVFDLEHQLKCILDQEVQCFNKVEMIEWASSQYRNTNVAKKTVGFYKKVSNKL